jgi:hypothetical protein
MFGDLADKNQNWKKRFHVGLMKDLFNPGKKSTRQTENNKKSSRRKSKLAKKSRKKNRRK